jgi:hypothetical protein
MKNRLIGCVPQHSNDKKPRQCPYNRDSRAAFAADGGATDPRKDQATHTHQSKSTRALALARGLHCTPLRLTDRHDPCQTGAWTHART